MILCGTDLSVASEAAHNAAASLARKHDTDLLLVHVLEARDSRSESAIQLELERNAGDLRRHFGVAVETQISRGVAEERLLELAKEHSATLIVVAARGTARHARKLGSVPEYLCQKADIPIFVARRSEHLLPWTQGRRPLRVLVASGLGDASRSALESVSHWPDLELTVTHVAWPFGEHYRLGVGGPIPLDHLRPEIHRQLLGDLQRWTAETRCRGEVRLDVSPGFGRIDCHLAELASLKATDLLVVGTHQRNLASRLWQGSVSRSAIHEAECSVLCVPQARSKRTVSAPRTVVIATDLSPLADRAIGYGYSLVGPGGTVHLVHVLEAPRGSDHAAIEQQLRARIPEDARSREISTEAHVLEDREAWLAIWQHASRANADLICMATHSRDAVKSLIVGSQAQALLQHSRIPVLLVPPDRES